MDEEPKGSPYPPDTLAHSMWEIQNFTETWILPALMRMLAIAFPLALIWTATTN
jgi:hypothetical protein